MIGREIFLGAMKFNAAAFGSWFLFIYWFCMNHTRTIIHMCLDSVPLPLVCAPDFIFGFLLRQANFHMDYLLHEIYCSHYFCCLFSSGFLRAEFVQVHTEYWIHIGLCATGMWPMHWIYMWTDLLFFFFGFFILRNWDFDFNSSSSNDTYARLLEILFWIVCEFYFCFRWTQSWCHDYVQHSKGRLQFNSFSVIFLVGFTLKKSCSLIQPWSIHLIAELVSWRAEWKRANRY